MKKYPTPHDSLFKKFFSDVSVAKDFLQIHLPPALREKCDFATLAVTSSTFIEDNMRPQYGDMLYSVSTTVGAGYIYCLIEHQSSADEMMAFRLLRYSILTMLLHLEQGNTKLPLVIPLLFYHGAQSPYPHSTRWFDCFEDPASAQELYCQPFPLVDLTVIPDDEIKTHRKVALLEYVQKHIRARDFNLLQPDIILLLKRTRPTKEQVACLLHYLLQEANALDMETFFRNLAKDSTGYQEEMMTIAEQLKLEGRQEGRCERDKEIALSMLSMGMDHATIAHITGLNDNEIHELMVVEA